MKEVSSNIEYKNKTYKLVFNLNVMEEIQEEYETLQKWGELTDGGTGEIGEKKKAQTEPNIKALIFGLTAMINEGIDIDNDENGTNEPFLSKKAVGRILSDVGIENVTAEMNNVVVESTKTEQKNG